MTIKRTVNGVEIEFELTDRELYNAFEEQQHIFDRLNMLDYLSDMSDEQLTEDYNITKLEAEKLVDDMAYRMRRYIDKYDCSWDYARDEAFQDILREHKAA